MALSLLFSASIYDFVQKQVQIIFAKFAFFLCKYLKNDFVWLLVKLNREPNMNKSELIAAIAQDSGLTKADSEKALNSFIAVVTKCLKKGDKLTIPGFVTASKSKRSARTGRNPQTGKEIKIAAKNVVKFKAGKTLDEAVNK